MHVPFYINLAHINFTVNFTNISYDYFSVAIDSSPTLIGTQGIACTYRQHGLYVCSNILDCWSFN